MPAMGSRTRTVPVPFFRPDLGEAEIEEVVATLRSGWLTTGPRTQRFETEFAAAVGASHGLAVNSCTAALHLALAALDLRPGQAVLVPAMTFAATAEVVRYLEAVPILVDCDPVTSNLDLDDAEAKLRPENWPAEIDPHLEVAGIIPVHVGGVMLDMEAVSAFARRHGLWVVEDAAHAFPAAWRPGPQAPWQRCGEGTSAVACFSFYANKTITTGEGGMAVTEDETLLERMRCLSLHGLSKDAWGRYTAKGSWDYRIVAPGFKYNLTDIAAAIGIHQLARAEAMRQERERLALTYREHLGELEREGFLELPPVPEDRLHAWHLFPIRLCLDRLTHLKGGRDTFLQELRQREIGYSVHWRPLHLHPYYEEAFGWRPEHLPHASVTWPRLVTLPLFPTMTAEEMAAVVEGVAEVCRGNARP
jgi:perosamine synthetase